MGWKGWEGGSAHLPTYCEATDVVKQEGAAEAAKKELEARPAEAEEQGTVLNSKNYLQQMAYNRLHSQVNIHMSRDILIHRYR